MNGTIMMKILESYFKKNVNKQIAIFLQTWFSKRAWTDVTSLRTSRSQVNSVLSNRRQEGNGGNGFCSQVELICLISLHQTRLYLITFELMIVWETKEPMRDVTQGGMSNQSKKAPNFEDLANFAACNKIICQKLEC